MKLVAPRLIHCLSVALVFGSLHSLSHAVAAPADPFTLSQVRSKPPIPPDRGSPQPTGEGASRGSATPTDLSQIQYKPPAPPDRGTPGGRGQGASRGPCQPANKPSLTALVPTAPVRSASTQPNQATRIWGLTSAEHPTVWVYVPYAKEAVSAEFVLQDEADNDIYRAAVKPAGVAGVVGVRVPDTIAPLQPGKLYHWFFKVKVACSSMQPSALDFVEGWVQRTTLDTRLTNQLKQALPRQKAELYAQNGLWYDALTTLAELRLANPNDPVTLTNWTSFLQSAGLVQAASVPIIQP